MLSRGGDLRDPEKPRNKNVSEVNTSLPGWPTVSYERPLSGNQFSGFKDRLWPEADRRPLTTWRVALIDPKRADETGRF
jgi:hypothetical protein